MLGNNIAAFRKRANMSQTELAIVNQIDYGTAPLMPAYRYKLTREQVLGLAVYIRSFAARHPGGQPASLQRRPERFLR